MPKLSIYVPDDLWEQVREGHPDANVSQVVQRGLAKLTKEEQESEPGYLERPSGATDRIAGLTARLAAEARHEYQRGYSAGLDVADELTLLELNELVALNFDVARWLARYTESVRWNMVEGLPPGPPPDVPPETVMAVLMGAAPPSAIPGEPLKPSWPWLKSAADALGSMADPIGFDNWNFTPPTPRVRGFRDALRDVWSGVEGSHVSASPSEPKGRPEGDAAVSDEDEPE